MSIIFLKKEKKERMRSIRDTFFSSPYKILITLFTVSIIYMICNALFSFIFVDANWNVILTNFHLLLVGSYPQKELWRIYVIFGLLLLMILVTFLTRTKLPIKVRISTWFLYFVFLFFFLEGIEGSVLIPKVSSDLWGGLLLTLLVTIVGIVFSFPLGVLLALGRTSEYPVIRYVSIIFIETMRGVPLITLLFIGQILIPMFLPPQWAIGNLMRVMIVVTLFSAAYMAEYVRGGLQSIPKGQVEAALALGMNRFNLALFITLPQAIKAVLPAIVGQCIAMFKDTSLVAIVGLIDLTGAAKAATGQPEFIGLESEVYLAIALIYWVFCFSMSKYSKRIENQLGRA